MDDLLRDERRSEFDAGDLESCFREMRAELTQLREEVATLRRENLELRQQVGYWKAMHAKVREQNEALQEEIEHLRAENRRLRQQHFGQKTEKQSTKDRSNHLEGFDEEEPSDSKKKKKRPGPKRRDFSHLPVQEEVIEVPADQQICATCQEPLAPMSDTEDSEQIEIEVKAYRRLIRRRRYRKTCPCAGCKTVTAPLEPKLIPKSRLGTSVWIEVLLAKYFNHQPIERLLTSWGLLGLNLADSTVNAGLEKLQLLFEPIYEALLERNRLSKYQQADETRWLMFVAREGKTGYRWWLWVFIGDDTVVYKLDPYRSRQVPQKHFPTGSKIVLMVDRLSSYKAMAQVKAGTILLAFCWAHVRRDFISVAKSFPELKEWAIEWLKSIRQAYRCNRERLQHEKGTPEFAAAETELRKTLEAMKVKAAQQLADSNLRKPCRKVLKSLQEHWIGLTRFVDDPWIPMDNNFSERQMRGPALGRKNYYGSGAEWSGMLATMLFSLFATLQMGKINPRHWLKWYFDACAAAGGKVPSDIQPFLPWNLSEEQRQTLSDPIPSLERKELSDSS